MPSKIASDLSEFRAMPFAQNQICKESIQRVKHLLPYNKSSSKEDQTIIENNSRNSMKNIMKEYTKLI